MSKKHREYVLACVIGSLSTLSTSLNLNDITVSRGEGQQLCDDSFKALKNDDGEGGQKLFKIMLKSFMDEP